MKKIEIIFIVISIIGTLMLAFHIPMGAMMTIIGISSLTMFYWGFSFALFNIDRFRDIFKKEAYKNTNAKRIIGAIATGLTLSILLTGILFVLMFWPGAKLNLMNGIAMGIVILLLALFFYSRTKSNYYIKIFKRLIVLLGLGILFYHTPKESIIKFRYGDDPELVGLMIQQMNDPDNQDIQKAIEEHWENQRLNE